MKECNLLAPLLAIPPVSLMPPEFWHRLYEPMLAIVQLIRAFRGAPVTPTSALELEHKLSELLREVGRCIVEWVYNDCESADRDILPMLQLEGVWYRRHHRKTANRNVATLFGKITLMRYLYRPIEELVPGIFPLEMRLGLAAARATAALAGRVGLYAAQCTQQTVLQALARDHGVAWSVSTLRKVTAAVARGMTQHRRAAQVAKLLELLREAGEGGRQAILCVGRDGIFTPVRKLHRGYCEAAVATVSVLDHLGKRLGTVYLGHMPQEGQGTLSDQLTSLILDVLKGWDGPLPRLVYVTDAGHHQTKYFKKLLRRLRHPVTGRRLRWEWVLDYYHACQYITDLAEALFGEGRQATAWAAKMRRWLKEKPKGIHRVLHSAAALRNLRGLSGTAKAFDDAYNYLRKRIPHLDYHGYRRRRLPIGSGVTEACCKTVVTQRMKQSGMTWKLEGGQAIMDLRVIYLSGIWEDVYAAHLRATEVQSLRTQVGESQGSCRNAA
jgi:hypothetical protein